MIIAPSVLDVNSFELAQNVQAAILAGTQRFHIDIMDGHFVPNLSFSPKFVKDFKEKFPLSVIEVHLMSNNLSCFIPAFVEAGADIIEFHYEATSQVNYWLEYLHNHNVKAGLVLNPETPVSSLVTHLNYLDQILLMSVHPGFGGQSFLQDTLKKIKQVKQLIKPSISSISIEVDGGVNNQNINFAAAAGCNVFVVGSYIFNAKNVSDQIRKLNRLVNLTVEKSELRR